jgi:hypothetical protein
VTESLRLRLHISEPFDFERENGCTDLFGRTRDHAADAEEWAVELEGGFTFNEASYDAALVAPRYVGESLSRVHDAILGVPVRIAHRTREGWHFALAGMLSIPSRDNTGNDDIESGELN